MPKCKDQPELKPCPFCGGPAAMHTYHHYGLGDEYWVACEYCEVRTSGGIGTKPSGEAKVWNRRVAK